MKKKIAILGSTGSIGKTTINLIKKNKKKFDVKLLTSNKNANILFRQARKLNVKNVIIFDKQTYLKYKKKFKKNKINIFHNIDKKNKLFKNKLDITVFGISGLAGLSPLISFIELSKKIAVANKESIICGWPIIKKKINRFNTELIPIDSEHFSIWKLIKNVNLNEIQEVFLTASGGPFLNKKYSKIRNINPKFALKHPNWKMGKKISIDSATMMNKVFEVIEAKKLFNLDIKKIKILIHPSSYIHSIIRFYNGTIKILAHETDMQIPIGNSIIKNFKYKKKKDIYNLNRLNNAKFYTPKESQYPTLNILNRLNNKDSLLEVILVAANDELVKYYLDRKIKYSDIYLFLDKILKMTIFEQIINKKQKTVKEINQIVEIVKSKVKKLVY
tara:strand:+ start:99 stop:1262 length:1164 start_codon:yes stop_codon:yes gene_type:complete